MGARSTGSHPTTTKADGHLLEYFRSDMGSGGGSALLSKFEASGGTKFTSGSNTYHVFTSTAPFSIDATSNESRTATYLIIGGGGGGGNAVDSGAYGAAGGGGAGGVITGTTPLTPATSPQTMTIGGGGTNIVLPAYPAPLTVPGVDGSPSSGFSLTAGGGGGGGGGSAPGGTQGAGRGWISNQWIWWWWWWIWKWSY